MRERLNSQSKWREKLHPIFFEIAPVVKNFKIQLAAVEAETKSALSSLGTSPPKTLVAEVMNRRREKADSLCDEVAAKIAEIDARYRPVPEGPLSFPHLQSIGTGNATLGQIEMLHSERHRESLQTTWQKANDGDLGAFKRLQRTEEDWYRITHGKGPLKGFHSDPYHRDLLQILFSFGGENLTSEELADCFEDYCPCGKEHDADALKKQRARLKRELQKS